MPRFDRLPPASADVIALNPDVWRVRKPAELRNGAPVYADIDHLLADGASTPERLIVVLPLLPPSVNHAYRSDGRGGRVLTDAAISFRERCAWEAKAAAMACGWQYQDGMRLELTVYVAMRKNDTDNRVKIAKDSIALGLGFDDEVIDKGHDERIRPTPHGPRCVLVLEVLSAQGGGDTR